MNRPQAMLIGNGPNRVAGNVSWPRLLRKAFSHVVGAPWRRQFGDAPYPLIYEQLLLEARKHCGWQERDLKNYLAEQMDEVRSGEIHTELMGVPVDHVLTTNYDRALERAAGGRVGRRNLGFIEESRYSLFRHRQVASGQRLWYIHGEARVPGSIMLGYDQYSGYLQQMRLYTTTGLEYTKGPVPPLFRRRQLLSEERSWIDLFFTADVWIIGLGLEFIELHLWWLLTFRARQKARKVKLPNRITYLCHASDRAARSKLAMLRRFDVNVRVIGSPNLSFSSFYSRCVDQVWNAA